MSKDNQQIPKVSVGLPVYNGERFLEEAIESSLAQTFPDFELIISDNGSTDRTRDICLRYAERDARVRFLPSDANHGASWNYCRVLDAARGQYFRWAPADDKFHPESLHACVEVLDMHADVVLCYPQTMLIGEHGEVLERYNDDLDFRSSDVTERFREAIRRNRLVSAIYGLIRTAALRKTGGLGGFPGADVTLLAELTLHGRFWEIPRPLFYRRLHGAASTRLTTMEAVQEWFDPTKKDKLFLYLWTHVFKHAAGIRRAPLGLSEKLRLLGVLTRWVIGVREHLLSEIGDAVGKILNPKKTTPIQQGDASPKEPGAAGTK
ncbi:MAG: glycosyltransferase [Nitrospira sp.]|nr:glycosyltransferase [Nitrospira sp.]